MTETEIFKKGEEIGKKIGRDALESIIKGKGLTRKTQAGISFMKFLYLIELREQNKEIIRLLKKIAKEEE